MTENSQQENTATDIAALPMIGSSPWQMTYGERIAFEGILAQLRPELAIEIGTAEGGSLSRIAAYASEVHSFDLVEPQLPVTELPHVHVHTGDNHVLLPAFLQELADAGRNVDFVMVDGDHSADGVERDILDLLESPAVTNTIILLHDTINEEVRRGIDRIDYASFAKVRAYDIDAVPGTMSIHPLHRGHLWGGIGVIVCSDRDVLPHIESPIIRNCVSPTRIGLAARAIAGFEVDRETDFVAMLEQRPAEMVAETVPDGPIDVERIPWRDVLRANAAVMRRAAAKLRGRLARNG